MSPNPQSPIPNPELDSLVRRVDTDRWLASRFAPADARARLVAVYAVNYEIARTAEVVTQSALGDIRLEWWREGLKEAIEGGSLRAHPAIAALAAAHRATPMSLAVFERLIAARRKDLDAEPFADWADIEDYVDATAGGVMRAALASVGFRGGVAFEGFVRPAARAWGYLGLLRAKPIWRAQGRMMFPRNGGSKKEMLRRARDAYAAARIHARDIGSALFPAFGYLALSPQYLRSLHRGERDPLLIGRQVRLVIAAATGRF